MDTGDRHKIQILMRRIHLISLIALLAVSGQTVLAGDGGSVRFRYGVEWGLNSATVSGISCSYITGEGYLVDSDYMKCRGYVNGCIFGFAGIELSRHFETRIYSGYMGLTPHERVVPAFMRVLYDFEGSGRSLSNSVFADAGAGFRSHSKPSLICRTGYRFRCGLTSHTALEINAGVLMSISHPDVKDKYAGGYVPREKLGISRSLNLGPTLTAALVF